MRTKHSLPFRLGVILLSLLPPFALADSAAPSDSEAAAAAPPQSASDKIEAQAEHAYDVQDLDIAIPLFTKAAEMNNLRAQVNLGELAEQAQLYDDAVGWYLESAMQGEPEGMYDLAKMYLSGNGIEKDESKALYWFKRSAEKKFAQAERVLADAYKAGLLGLKVDPEQAAYWDARAKHQEALNLKILQENLAKLAESRKKEQEEAAKKAAEAEKKGN